MPTFNIVPTPQNAVGYMRVVFTNSGTSFNTKSEIYRRQINEYAGQFILIGQFAASGGGTFLDYNVANGLSYDYFGRAYDGSGNTSDTAVASAAMGFSNSWIHNTVKAVEGQNLYGSALELYTPESHDRQIVFNNQAQLFAGNAKPDVEVSEIEDGSWQIPVIIPARDDSKRTVLRTIYETRRPIVFRTPNGTKVLGVLRELTERYQTAQTEIVLRLEQTCYSEAI